MGTVAPLAEKDRRGVCRVTVEKRLVLLPRLINMQSHSRESTGTFTSFDKYQSHSRESTGPFSSFDKFAKSQSRSDCYAATVIPVVTQFC